jgi:hypothetical protein
MYVKLKFTAENTKVVQTEFLKGPSSPFVFHSLLANLELKTNIQLRSGVLIYRLLSKINKTVKGDTSFKPTLQSPNNVKQVGSNIRDRDSGREENIIIFKIDNFSESYRNDIKNFLYSAKFAGGMITDLNIEYSLNIEKFNIERGYKLLTKSERTISDNYHKFVLNTCMYSKGEMNYLSILGYKKLSKKNKFFSHYGRDHILGETLVGLIKYDGSSKARAPTSELFDKKKWITRELEDKIEITTDKKRR